MTNDRVEPDGVLRALVTAANAMTEPVEDGVGITLTLSGQVVSGQLIPNWKWFEDQAVKLTELGNERHRGKEGERPEGLEAFFAEAHKAVTEQAKESAAAWEAVADLAERYKAAIRGEDTTAFVHLMNARVFAPGQSGMPAEGMYWRGRLRDVAGWSFGQLQAQSVTP
jgi:hypothetical protein